MGRGIKEPYIEGVAIQGGVPSNLAASSRFGSLAPQDATQLGSTTQPFGAFSAWNELTQVGLRHRSVRLGIFTLSGTVRYIRTATATT